MTDNTNYNYGYTAPNPDLHVLTTAEGTYNKPGLPNPPAGYGKKIGFTDSKDGDDEGPESPDEC